LIARLKPEATIEQARAEMGVLFRWTVEERVRANANESRRALERRLTFAVRSAASGLSTPLRDQFGKPLLALMAVVAILLFIACANVAGLLLARGASRQREIALRVSLGAGRFRLVRQVLTESLLLASAGALLGILVAYFGTGTLAGIMTSGRFIGGTPRFDIPVIPDPPVLLFTGGLALLTGVLFGLAPAWTAFTTAPVSSLREVRGSDMRFRRLFGKGLVVAQVALSVALLSAAGLFLRHLSGLKHSDLGFDRDRVLLLTLDPSRNSQTDEQIALSYRDLIARFEAIPGVHSATLSAPSPLSGAGASRYVTVEGHSERPEDRRYVSVSWVGPRYFETLATPRVAGREFRFEDAAGSRVAIINEAMARYYFGGANPIGKYVLFDRGTGPYEIVGVARNAKYSEIREADVRTIYLSAFELSRPPPSFALRTSIDPEDVGPAARAAVLEVLKDVPVSRVRTLADQVDATIVPERLIALLSGAFGALGALLAALGMYGLLAYTVARRIHEVGVRMALGASPAAASRMVLGGALRMAGAGLSIGIPLAWGCRRLAAFLIPDLPVSDLTPIAFGAAAMIAIAVAAAWLPAHRAARVDPVVALRHE
jgi:predicted permease